MPCCAPCCEGGGASCVASSCCRATLRPRQGCSRHRRVQLRAARGRVWAGLRQPRPGVLGRGGGCAGHAGSTGMWAGVKVGWRQLPGTPFCCWVKPLLQQPARRISAFPKLPCVPLQVVEQVADLLLEELLQEQAAGEQLPGGATPHHPNPRPPPPTTPRGGAGGALGMCQHHTL